MSKLEDVTRLKNEKIEFEREMTRPSLCHRHVFSFAIAPDSAGFIMDYRTYHDLSTEICWIAWKRARGVEMVGENSMLLVQSKT